MLVVYAKRSHTSLRSILRFSFKHLLQLVKLPNTINFNAYAATHLMPSSKLIRTRIAASFFRPRTGVCIHSPAQITPVAGSWQASVAFNAQQPSRKLADVRDDNISLVGSSIKPALSPRTVQEPTDSNHALAPDGQGNGQPPDERTVRLGKSM